MAATSLQSGLALKRNATASISTATSKTTSTQPACTWPGHCLGAACLSNNDCDHDWICTNNICSECCFTPSIGTSTFPTVSPAATETPKKELTTGSLVGIVAGAIVLVLLIIVGIICWCWRRHKSSTTYTQRPTSQESQLKPLTFPDGLQQFYIAEAIGEAPLPGPQDPVELECREFVELEGDYKTTIQQLKI